MKLKSGILLITGLLSLYLTFAQSDVNYQHKALIEALQKVGITDMSVIKEIAVPDSIFSKNQIDGKYFLVKENKVSPRITSYNVCYTKLLRMVLLGIARDLNGMGDFTG